MPTDSSFHDDPEYQRLEALIWDFANKGLDINLDTLIPVDRPDLRPPLERVVRRARMPWTSSPFQNEETSGAPWYPGQKIGDDYQVEVMLGKGGMGEVYRVRRISDRSVYAVKRARRGLCRQPFAFNVPNHATRVSERHLLRELMVWISLPYHLNIAQCRFFRLVDKDIVIFIEYVNGGSLHEWIIEKRLYARTESEQLQLLLEIALQSIRGLFCIHAEGVVHQDIKPSNLLLTSDGVVKISDFGIARAYESNQGSRFDDATGSVEKAGFDPCFCSPEQYQHGTVTKATDIWSWGATILTMFLGESKWKYGGGAVEALDISNGRPCVAIPPPVVDLLRGCLCPEPETRPSSSELRNELERIYTKLFSRSYSENHPVKTPRRLTGRHSGIARGTPLTAAEAAELYMDDEADQILKDLCSEDDHFQMYMKKGGLLLGATIIRRHGAANFHYSSVLLERAYDYFLRGHRGSPDRRLQLGTAFITLGQLLFSVNRIKKAAKHLRKGIKLIGKPSPRNDLKDLNDLLSDAKANLLKIKECRPPSPKLLLNKMKAISPSHQSWTELHDQITDNARSNAAFAIGLARFLPTNDGFLHECLEHAIEGISAKQKPNRLVRLLELLTKESMLTPTVVTKIVDMALSSKDRNLVSWLANNLPEEHLSWPQIVEIAQIVTPNLPVVEKIRQERKREQERLDAQMRQAIAVEKRRAWEAIVQDLQNMQPAERLVRLAQIEDCSIWFFPLNWADVNDTDLASIDDPTRRLLIERLVPASVNEWRCLRKRLLRLQTRGNLQESIYQSEEHYRIRLNPKYALVYCNRRYAYLRKGEYDKAIIDSTKAIRLKPEVAEGYKIRGYAYLRKGEYGKAIADGTEAIRLDSEATEGYNIRGYAYLWRGEYDKAIVDYTEAIRLEPEIAEGYDIRGGVYLRKGEYDKAIADGTEAIRLEPEVGEGYHVRGYAYLCKGEHSKAIVDYTEAIRIDPKCALAYCNRGDANQRIGEYEKAIVDYTEAIRLKPKYALAYFKRGGTYSYKSESDKAEADFVEAKKLGLSKDF